MWSHSGATWSHSGSTLITWPADLTTANRSAYNCKQNKLVRSVEQTRFVSPKNLHALPSHKLTWFSQQLGVSTRG